MLADGGLGRHNLVWKPNWQGIKIIMDFYLELLKLRNIVVISCVASFCLYIGSWTMHVQKEGIFEEWVPSLQEANLPQGN